jgi:dynein heavy chain, axonemal
VQLDIEEKVRLAKDTEIKISAAREVYRPVATRGSLMYFLIDNINTLDRVYHYSMANYVYILRKGMDVTPGGADESKVPVAQRLEEEVRAANSTESCVVVHSWNAAPCCT